MCGSRKYPYPHHRGNWKLQRGGEVKGPGTDSGKEGGRVVTEILFPGDHHYLLPVHVKLSHGLTEMHWRQSLFVSRIQLKESRLLVCEKVFRLLVMKIV